MRMIILSFFLLIMFSGYAEAQDNRLELLIESAHVDVLPAYNEQQPITGDNVNNVRLLTVLPRRACIYFRDCPITANEQLLTTWDEKSIIVQSLLNFDSITTFDTPTWFSTSVSLSGQFIVLNVGSGRIELHNIHTGSVNILTYDDTVMDMQFSTDESKLILQTNSYISAIELDSAQENWRLESDTSVRVTVGTDWLVLYPLNEGQIQIVSIYDGSELRTLSKSSYTKHAMVVSDDGRWLATSTGSTLYYWDLNQLRPIENQISLGDSFGPESILFSPVPDLLLTTNYEEVRVWYLPTAELLRTIPTNPASFWDLSPDGRLIVLSNPLRIIDLITEEVHIIDGYYSGRTVSFDLTGSTLVLDNGVSMILGIPDENRPAWEPTIGNVVPSDINVRLLPEQGQEIIGTATGEVIVSARTASKNAVYLPDYEGWVWTAPAFFEIDEAQLNRLPVRSTEVLP